MKRPLGSIRPVPCIYSAEGFLRLSFQDKVSILFGFKDTGAAWSQLSLILFSFITSACGGEELPEGVTPMNSEYVLTVFELQSPTSGPCPALMALSSDLVGDEGWSVCFPREEELSSVMDCLVGEETVLFESTGEIAGWGVSRTGWDIFAKRRMARGDEVVSVTGHGELALSLGVQDGERYLLVDMELRHKSGELSIDNQPRYEGVYPRGSSLVFYRFLDDRASAPQLCVVLELQG